MPEKNHFICSDGQQLAYNLWMPESGDGIRCFLQIIHGMAEHSARYERFAKHLNERGIAVFALDLRGHGKSVGPDGTRGWFAESDGWSRVADDCFEFANFITSRYAAPEVFLMGHSMGSFLARTVMVMHPDFYSGVIIMGTGASQGLVGKVGKAICRGQVKKKGSRSPGELMNKLSFGSYNKGISNPETPFDWLSTDRKEVQKYMNDPDCGFMCTNGFFLDLLEGIEYANSALNAEMLHKDMPLLIISGDKDPVGDMGKGVKKVFRLYRKAGIADVSLELLPGMRHEILNETGRRDVYDIILNWLEKHSTGM